MALHHDVIAVSASGTTVTSGATTANVALPTTANGLAPKFVRLQVDGFMFVRLGDASVVATTNDLLLSPNEAEVVVAAGAAKIAYIQSTAAAKLNIIPLEA